MDHFQENLKKWYQVNKRELPWRNTRDPYKIWLSEVVLQQTRVDQGKNYYLRFIKSFPTVSTLARASEQEVLSLWQGLGYYSRARNLHKAARYIEKDLKGSFPQDYNSLLKLPGVGPYTAAAIASFSFGEPTAVLDGNVFRVLSRLYDISTAINSPKGVREFNSLSQGLISMTDPATHNQAIMDFGAMICIPKRPKCNICPFTIECKSLKKGTVSSRPVKTKKVKVRNRYFVYTVYYDKDDELLFFKKRTAKDIWQNLFDFDLEELKDEKSFSKKIKNQSQNYKTTTTTHKLTHQHINALFVLNQRNKKNKPNSLVPVRLSELKNIPLPTLIKNYIQNETAIAHSF
tara:strand:- start:1920 stop:2957 length:1038 start_codon:yes stop_codon:yes gene_type:complete